MQTNRDVVQSLSTRKLAALFVYRVLMPEFDYNSDDELEQCGEYECFLSTLIHGQWNDVFEAISAVEKYLESNMDDDWEYELNSQSEGNERAVS